MPRAVPDTAGTDVAVKSPAAAARQPGQQPAAGHVDDLGVRPAPMPAGATLIVIEGVQHHNTPHPRFSMIDLQMLVVTEGGRERSIPELEHLIAAAGLHRGRTRRTATDLALIEATKPL